MTPILHTLLCPELQTHIMIMFFCFGVCLSLVFETCLRQCSRHFYCCLQLWANQHMSLCNLSVTHAAAAFHISQYFSLDGDVYTRSNRESIWWLRHRVFEECQEASGSTHTHKQKYRHTSTNAFNHVSIYSLFSLSISLSLSEYLWFLCTNAKYTIAQTIHCSNRSSR